MSEHESDQTNPSDDATPTEANQAEANQPGEISDDMLPEDLQPSEDNPLARHPGQTGDDEDRIGADTESGDAENPSTTMTYGSGPASDASSEEGDAPADGRVQAEEDDGSEALEHGGGGAG